MRLRFGMRRFVNTPSYAFPDLSGASGWGGLGTGSGRVQDRSLPVRQVRILLVVLHV